MKNIIEALNWRYATKQFDPSKKLSQKEFDALTEAMRLSPSSFGLQPWKFIVVSNPEVRAKLREAAYGQAQVTDASHLIVIAAEKNLSEASVARYVKSTSDVRGVPVESLKAMSDMLNGAIARLNPEQRTEWAARQAYIALGVLVAAAAIEGIDAGPMEGFDPAKFDEILGLDKLGVTSKAMVALGHRLDTDPYIAMKKVRFPKEEVFVEIK
jgi:nitroreductase/dihydropteridine reductase